MERPIYCKKLNTEKTSKATHGDKGKKLLVYEKNLFRDWRENNKAEEN